MTAPARWRAIDATRFHAIDKALFPSPRLLDGMSRGAKAQKGRRHNTGEQSEKSRTPNRKFGRSADVRCAWAVGFIFSDFRKSLSQACVAVAVRAINGTPGRKERNCPSLR